MEPWEDVAADKGVLTARGSKATLVFGADNADAYLNDWNTE